MKKREGERNDSYLSGLSPREALNLLVSSIDKPSSLLLLSFAYEDEEDDEGSSTLTSFFLKRAS